MANPNPVHKFKPGWKGGPGRPKRQTELKYLKCMEEVTTLEEWKAICERAVADAIKGDAKARDWLAKYLIGDNTESILELMDKLQELQDLVEMQESNRTAVETPEASEKAPLAAPTWREAWERDAGGPSA